jgi:hypothetical protein
LLFFFVVFFFAGAFFAVFLAGAFFLAAGIGVVSFESSHRIAGLCEVSHVRKTEGRIVVNTGASRGAADASSVRGTAR